MTAEEIFNINMNNEHFEIVQDVADLSSVINSSGDCRQDIKKKMRLKRAAMRVLGKITKSSDVSLETKAKIKHTLVSPVTLF